jgi:hypothetical protein
MAARMNKTERWIWAVAAVTAGTALYLLPDLCEGWSIELHMWLREGNPPFIKYSILTKMLAFYGLIFVAKVIASYGLFRFRSWGRTLAICALSVEFLYILPWVIKAITVYLRHPEWVRFHTIIKLILGWTPGYLSLICVIILLAGPVRERFRKTPIQTVEP